MLYVICVVCSRLIAHARARRYGTTAIARLRSSERAHSHAVLCRCLCVCSRLITHARALWFGMSAVARLRTNALARALCCAVICVVCVQSFGDRMRLYGRAVLRVRTRTVSRAAPHHGGAAAVKRTAHRRRSELYCRSRTKFTLSLWI